MSLLNESMVKAHRVEKRIYQDEFGDFITSYIPLDSFKAAVILDGTSASEAAGAITYKKTYTVTAEKGASLSCNDIIVIDGTDTAVCVTELLGMTPVGTSLSIEQAKAVEYEFIKDAEEDE